MKIIVLILIIAVFIQFQSIAQPKIKVDCGNEYNWGKVSTKDSPLKAKIKLINSGNQDLIIFNVKPSCGCTLAPLNKDTIAPGDFGTLDVSLNTGTIPDNIEKYIELITNDPDNVKYTISLKAEVLVPITVFPTKYFRFGLMKLNEENICKLILNNKSGSDIKIDSITFSPKELIINLKNNTIIQKDSIFVLEASFKPVSYGNYSFHLEFKTDNPEMPEMIINGKGTVIP